MLGGVASLGWEVLDRIRFGDFAISPHGIGIAAGYLAGSWWLMREGRRRGLSEDDIAGVLLRALIGAIVGARFFYVLAHFSEFDRFVDMLKIWEGGISLIGGIFGAIIFAYPYMRKHRMGFLRTMDAASIGLAFGILFGRVGDLIIGDHLGKPTSWLLAFRYEGGNLSGFDCVADACRGVLPNGQLIDVILGQPVRLLAADGTRVVAEGVGIHQTALYDFISTFFLFAVLLLLNTRLRRTGTLIAVFGIWYGIGRIVTDFLRVDKQFFGLTGSQWASVAVVLISLVALLKWWREGRYGGEGDEEERVPALEGAAITAEAADGDVLASAADDLSATVAAAIDEPGRESSGGGEGDRGADEPVSVTDFTPPRDPTTGEAVSHGPGDA